MRGTGTRLGCLLWMCLLVAETAGAQSLSVEKVVQPDRVSTGDQVQVVLKFTNPFGKEVPVRIMDKSILGGSGLDVQCLDYTLPADRSVVVSYDPIRVYQAGDYTLDPATVTYTNPSTGSQESVVSNSPKVVVQPSASAGQQQGVTTLYQCGGIRFRSSSFSSGGSTSITISPPQAPGPAQTPTGGSPGVSQPLLSRESQDLSSIQREIERERQERAAMEERLRQLIENNTSFREMVRELQQQGYNFTNRTIQPTSNASGLFQYNFQRGGQTALLRGEVENSTVQNLTRWTAEDLERLRRMLERSPEFQRLQSLLAQEGYTLSSSQLTPPDRNESRFLYQYQAPGNRTGEIQGAIAINGTVTRIELRKPPAENPWVSLVAILLSAFAVLAGGWYLYRRLRRPGASPEAEPVPLPRPVDLREEALRLLERARELFRSGAEKEAYAAVSEALRLHFRHLLGVDGELTSTEALVRLRGRQDGHYVARAERCLALCDSVEFARYRPSPEDADRILKDASDLVA